MKRILLLLLFILTTSLGLAQYTAISDPNFELALITQGIDSEGGPVDGQVLTTDINSLTTLDISSSGINDLSGLEAFTALEILNVSGNDLNSLELQNLSLIEIRANSCNLSGKSIRFQNNPPTGSFLTNVTSLFLEDNNYGSPGSSISFGGVPNVKNLYLKGNSFGSIFLGETIGIEILRLEDNPNLNTINDLTSLTELLNLDVSNCALSSLVVSSNQKLTTLRIGGNPLNTINLRSNPLLNVFVLEETQISSLDFSQNLNLGVVAINNSLLNTIDFSDNPNLSFVNVFQNNNLTSLNLKNGNNALLSNLLATATPNLECIQVDNVVQSNNKIDWQKDTDSFYAIDCNANTISILDTEFERALINQNIDTDGIINQQIFESDALTVTALNLSGSTPIIDSPPGLGITDLSGIEFFTNLETLRVEGNSITALNLSQNRKLKVLRAWRNGLETLNVQGLPLLEIVGLNFNNLTNANFAANIALQSLDITDNNLTSITLPNGTTTLARFTISNNVNLTSLDISGVDSNLTTLDARGNSALPCIQVTNVDTATAQANWQKDATTVYNTDCSSNTPFEVTASLLGAGTGPNYEISEGETFSINFNAGNTAINGDQYSPEIQFSLNGVGTIEDFLINGSETIPNSTFTVSTNNPDGSISIQAKTDDFLESDEVYNITINSRNNNEYTISEPTSFTLTIKDVAPTDPFIVTPYLSINENTIQEGQSFRIYFEADDSQYYNDQSFDVLFNSTQSSATFGLDYTHEDSPSSFVVRYQQDAEEYIEVNVEEDLDENENEEIIIILEKDPNNVYAWENADNNGNVTFRIRIEDIPTNASDPFEIETTLSGNVTLDNNNNYTVDEGETIILNLNALTPVTESYSYSVSYTIAGTTASSDDYNLLDNSPKIFIAQNSISPDGVLQFFINTDEISDNDVNEKLVINLLPDPNSVYTWSGNNLNDDGSLTYEFTINDVSPIISDTITAEFSNSGGIEGGTETFTVTLLDSQGKPWSDHDGFEFSLDFKNEIFDTDIQFSIDEGKILGEVASSDNYKNQNGTDLGSNPQIIIPANESKGNFIISYPDDSDDFRDYYSVELTNTNANISIVNEKIQAVILDQTGQFLINIYPGVNMSIIPADDMGNFDPGCCLEFSVEEGEQFIIYLDVEKGVPAGRSYDVRFNFDNSVAEEGTDKDFTYENAGTTIKGTVTNGLGPFDNRLIINVNEDDVPNERVDGSGDDLIGEKLRINFTSLTNQFTIADRFFDQDAIENEGDTNKLSIRSIFGLRIIDVIKVQEFKVSETNSVAEEFPSKNAEFEIILETANASGKDMPINYELITTGQNIATPIADYLIDNYDQSTGKGFVVIPNGETMAKITVQPVNDPKFEPDENVVVQLIDGPQYSISQLSSKQVIIKSEDEADYTATIQSGTDNESSESLPDDFAEVIIELSEVPVDDIEVLFKISDQTEPAVVIGGEEPDFIIYQDDLNTVIPMDNLKVIFEANVGKRKSIFVKALPDTFEENIETLLLQLDNGVNYRPISTADAPVLLKSTTTDVSNFDPSSISLVAKKPRCPGANQEGSIEITNASGFHFNVNVKGLENDKEENIELGTSDSENFRKETNELPIGRYEVTISFDIEKNTSIPENVITPKYIVEIEELPAMLVEEQGINLKSKMGEFIVSGSTSYIVRTNGEVFNFFFEDIGDNTLSIPLIDGVNSVEIFGEAVCQGSIKKEILLNNIFIYPNPTDKIVSIFSKSLKKPFNIYLFDMQGRLVYKINSSKTVDKIDLDISNLQKGMYLGKIVTESNSEVEFKLLKK